MSGGSAVGEAPLTIRFAEMRDTDGPLTGEKARSLGTLGAAGFPVPDGFVLTTDAFRRFVAENGLGPDLERIEARVAEGGLSLKESWEFLGAARKRMVAAPLPASVAAALGAALGATFAADASLAVRSSGTREDLEGASFAGQYETFLNVRGEDAVADAVKRCWASVFRNRVLQYAGRRGGVRVSELGIAVIVQRMVEAAVSGVLFTVNPVTGREREALIESVFGLGEALVSGRVDADRYVVDIESGAVLSREIKRKALAVTPLPPGASEVGPAGGAVYTREVPLEGEAATRATLERDSDLAELARIAGAVQEHYGRPMDIEWIRSAEGDGRFYLVQARPITKTQFAPDFGEWTTADFKDGGVSADVCTPFMWSCYEAALERSMPRYFKDLRLLPEDHEAKWGRMFFGRPYWNLGEVKNVLAKIPGFVERNFDVDLGVEVTYDGPGRTTRTTVGGVLRALPVLFALKRSYRERLAIDRAFARSFPDRARPFDLEPHELRALDRTAFVERYRTLMTGLYIETETSYFFTIYNTSNSKLDWSPHFERAKRACGGELSYLALVGGLEDLSHMRPMRDLFALCKGLRESGRALTDDDVRVFARRFRHQSQRVLDLRVPRWGEDLTYVRELVERGAASFDPRQDPEAQARAQHERYLAERAKAARALRMRPFARRAFEKGLELVRTYAWWREEMRDLSTFAYYLVRLFTVEAGRRLAIEGALAADDDVFYLRHEEVLDLLDGKMRDGEARRRVEAGRRLLRSFRNFKNPNEIGSRYRFAEAAPGASAPAEGGLLRGTGCAPGRVEARAKVVRTLDEARKVEAGEILVTVFTDPGWTPLLGLVAGVVTETGGLLSHAAVISREYGVPAVLAVPGATSAIHDGDTVVVDGGAGTVEIKARG